MRPFAEKMITKARKGDLHSRRVVLRTIRDNAAVTKLFDEVAPRYSERPGGYTRITKLGPRQGDGAEVAVIELV
jgi:large subunit ribosomal protein L17